MKDIKEFINTISIVILIFLFAASLVGGFMYYFFPREDKIGDSSIITACEEKLGGQTTWKKWPNGCTDSECYFLTCASKPLN